MLELFEPAGAARLEVTVVVAHGCRKEFRLLSDDAVRQRETLALMISGPVGKCSLDVGEFAFRPFYG